MQVQLPKTDFPMKGNLSTTEPARIKAWQDGKVYEKILKKPAPKGKFTMPDGPPYANGNIHVGHVLNKVLKDIVIKYKNLAGYKAAFTPGWDCHGLPIELNVTKKLGPKRKDMSDAEIRKLCREEARSWVDKQRVQFQRLGILADWDKPYLTMDPAYEADEIRVLAKIFENGIFYRGEKPVYWDPALQTALAAAEVEYKDHKSLSIFVKFKTDEKFSGLPSGKPVSFLIWTTTPWTLPANYGIALNPEFTYGFFDTGSDVLILAEDLKESVEKETGLSLTLISTKKGSEFDRMKARHPFMERDSLVVLGDHVTLDAGSGAVHTAPGHGLEDYVVGLKYDLPVHSPVDEAGRFRDEVKLWPGEKIADANPKIVEHLRSIGALVAVKEITHSYPHSPRSKAPLIFRATPQWFVRMDDDKYPLRKKCLDAAEKDIGYVPKWGIQRLTAMLANTPDWCLSRQRIWGVPVPVYYCDKCKAPLVDSSVMNKLADKMESTGQGLEVYHSTPAREFTTGKKCACGNDSFVTGKDILDVWFDSGICHTAVQKRSADLEFPADIYLEGSDQHRGWFQTSLVSAMAAEGRTPFKAVEVGRQRRRPRRNHQGQRRRNSALVGFARRLRTRSDDLERDDGPDLGYLSPLPQHDPLFARQLERLRSGEGSSRLSRHDSAGPVGSAQARRADRFDHRRLRRLRVLQSLSRAQHVLRAGPVGGLFGYFERPLVHRQSRGREAPGGSDGALPDAPRTLRNDGADRLVPCGRDLRLYPGREKRVDLPDRLPQGRKRVVQPAHRAGLWPSFRGARGRSEGIGRASPSESHRLEPGLENRDPCADLDPEST
jgi:isoleucyl-tRNA synthetase